MQVILLAVPDHAIVEVAGLLARSGEIRRHHTVLHLCGALDRSALAELEPSGAALGSFHPLQALSDPHTAPERLRGAVAGVEGDRSAVEVASELARRVGLVPVSITPGSKAKCHAGAVFGSNYVVTLAATARDLLEGAGLSRELAWDAALALIQGAVENLATAGPEGALTGPVARGDVETIRRHAAALSPEEVRLYRVLAQATARLAGLDDAQVREVDRALGSTEG